MKMKNNTLPKSLHKIKWLPKPLEMAEMLYHQGNSPWNFVFKHTFSFTRELSCLLRHYYFEGLLKPLLNVKSGDIVCYSQSENKAFRAVVLDLLPDDRIKILLLDYNIFKIVNQKDIFILPTDVIDIPVQYVYCSLMDLNNEDEKLWNNDLRDIFNTIVSENRLYVNVKDKPMVNTFPPKFSVELFAHNSSSKLRLNVNKWICQIVLPELKQLDQNKEYDDLMPFLSDKAIDPFHISASEPESCITITAFPILENEIDMKHYDTIQKQRQKAELESSFPNYSDHITYAIMEPNMAPVTTKRLPVKSVSKSATEIRSDQTENIIYRWINANLSNLERFENQTKPLNDKNSSGSNIINKSSNPSSHENQTEPLNNKNSSGSNIINKSSNPSCHENQTEPLNKKNSSGSNIINKSFNPSSHENRTKPCNYNNFSGSNIYKWSNPNLSNLQNQTKPLNNKNSSGNNIRNKSSNPNLSSHKSSKQFKKTNFSKSVYSWTSKYLSSNDKKKINHNLKKPSGENLSSNAKIKTPNLEKSSGENDMHTSINENLSSNDAKIKTPNMKKSSGKNDMHTSTNENLSSNDGKIKTPNLEKSSGENDMHSSTNNELSRHEYIQDWINAVNLKDLGDPTEVCDTFFDIGTCDCRKCTRKINLTKKSHPDLLEPPEMVLPNIDAQVKMKILNVISCDLFFASLLPGYTALTDMMKDINHPVNTKMYRNIPNVASGQFVLAKGSDGLFRRAEVMDVETDYVEAFFVDFGYSEPVEKLNLRHIYQRFLNLPRQAILSSLPTINADNDTDAHNTLALMINDKELNAVILKRNYKDSKLQVNLLLENGECITNFMKRNGYSVYV